ncbi:beta-propeller domain-containing protein, partial [bacterium]|nr:beta-propeller domain-containing protein [bacterium]
MKKLIQTLTPTLAQNLDKKVLMRAALLTSVLFIPSCSFDSSRSPESKQKIQSIWDQHQRSTSTLSDSTAVYLTKDSPACEKTTAFLRDQKYKLAYKNYSSYADTQDSCSECEVMEDAVSNTIGGPSQPESASSSKSSPGTIQESHSRTNVQVAGVEEADTVKTDGTHIYYVTGRNKIRVFNSDNELVATHKLISKDSGSVYSLLLLGDSKVVALVQNYEDANSTSVYKVDFSNLLSVSSKKLATYPGQIETVRRISDVAYLTYTKYMDLYEGTSPYDHSGVSRSNAPDFFSKDLNRIKSMSLSELTGLSSSEAKTLCRDVMVPSVAESEGVTTVASLDLLTGEKNQVSVLSAASEVYANHGSLYLGSLWGETTDIHKFSLDKLDIQYKASANLGGRILNQFSMDEYKGVLRVAVTEGFGGIGGIGGVEPNVVSNSAVTSSRGGSVNRVVTLSENTGKIPNGGVSNQLKILGQTEDLARGERIYSVRFNKDKGYVVTFREVDPLFTLDLSNPENPEVKGELKVPGVSTYIHLIGEDRLLTVGRSADFGVKLSLFDVSDMENPTESYSTVLSDSWASEAQSNHKAFTYYAPFKKLVIPTELSSGKSGIKVFNIEEDFIEEAGTMTLSSCRGGWRGFGDPGARGL